ncbi:hypothetical protein D0T50_06975 [Bacteroides sp. 214]|uniref:S24/S26 family peptidase n=1 Tax=Bacteroides sp. 214 TaxID=2302935 RepID=UPI0013D6451B|nr:S24/S26 family peptidase [Bacteroides sp. 214]NDW12631.1 hypothetical protein [Bacteroides sp. 214]
MEKTRTKAIANEVLLKETAMLIAEGHTVTHLVRGNSMNPFMVDRRDKVVLSPFTEEELLPGVVVLARDDMDRLVLHRIICRKGNNLTLMGDGNVVGTEETSTDRVLGVVTTVIRKGKKYSCNGKVWRRYSVIWVNTLPLRRIVLGVWRRIAL